MIWIALLSGGVVGLVFGGVFGFGAGMKVRAELAMSAVQLARRTARWASVQRRREQEARARHIAANADEPCPPIDRRADT